MDPKEKVRENRIRRVLHRRGFMLRKSRIKDPYALDFGKYWIVNLDTNFVVAGGQYKLNLDQVEEWIKEWEKEKNEQAKKD